MKAATGHPKQTLKRVTNTGNGDPVLHAPLLRRAATQRQNAKNTQRRTRRRKKKKEEEEEEEEEEENRDLKLCKLAVTPPWS